MKASMQPLDMETRYCANVVAPCACAPADDIHGFTLEDGVRSGLYLATRRVTGDVRWLDVAFSAGRGVGTVAVRVWVDRREQRLGVRVVAPGEVDEHPALMMGGWLDRAAVAALDRDVTEFVAQLVLGDDRLSAHLFDADASASPAHAPTALALPIHIEVVADSRNGWQSSA
jgi:hypothetical protein